MFGKEMGGATPGAPKRTAPRDQVNTPHSADDTQAPYLVHQPPQRTATRASLMNTTASLTAAAALPPAAAVAPGKRLATGGSPNPAAAAAASKKAKPSPGQGDAIKAAEAQRHLPMACRTPVWDVTELDHQINTARAADEQAAAKNARKQKRQQDQQALVDAAANAKAALASERKAHKATKQNAKAALTSARQAHEATKQHFCVMRAELDQLKARNRTLSFNTISWLMGIVRHVEEPALRDAVASTADEMRAEMFNKAASDKAETQLAAAAAKAKASRIASIEQGAISDEEDYPDFRIPPEFDYDMNGWQGRQDCERCGHCAVPGGNFFKTGHPPYCRNCGGGFWDPWSDSESEDWGPHTDSDECGDESEQAKTDVAPPPPSP